MARPRFTIFGVIYEALGFSVRHFWTALRLAWLPLALLLVLEAAALRAGVEMGPATVSQRAILLNLEPGYTFRWVEALLALFWAPLKTVAPFLLVFTVAVVLQASFAVPLIRLASTGARPPSGSAVLTFGPRHVKYVLASAVAFAGVIFGTRALGVLVMNALGKSLSYEVTVFKEGSLHDVRTEALLQPVNDAISRVNAWWDQSGAAGVLERLGLDIAATDLAVSLPLLALTAYLLLRLMPLPFFAAARDGGASYTSIGRTWALSRGMNIFPLFGIAVLFGLIQIAVSVLAIIGMNFGMVAFTGSGFLLESFDNLVPDGPVAPIVRGIIALSANIFVVVLITFGVVLNAGLGGALVHRGIR